MSLYTVILDANIFYSAPLRDIFLELALDGFFRARWTADIHHEWIEAVLKKKPELKREKLERTKSMIDQAISDGLITAYESLIPSIQLPDPKDRHVLAAAIVGRCDMIVTKNLKDFPRNILEVYGIEAQDPDTFLVYQFDLFPEKFCSSVKKVRERLKNPPFAVDDYLKTLQKVDLLVISEKLWASSNKL